MRHEIPVESLGPQAEAMARAVEACVHCGFCLPACPTYHVLGEEMDSPRGRIILMKETLEGNLDLEETLPYVDRCLGCLGCVTACPSGVEYGQLLTPFRAYADRRRHRTGPERMIRTMMRYTLPFPGRFRVAAFLGRVARPFRRLLPPSLGAMLALLPDRLPPPKPLPEFHPAQGKRRARVALLAGCVQQVLAPQVNWATLRVLARNGVEVVVPRGQGCCGALAMHDGEADQARRLARRNLEIFAPAPSNAPAGQAGIDAILTNAAGCGSGMAEYPLLFAGQPEGPAARRFATGVQDVSVFLDALGLEPPPPLDQSCTVAYHDPCHLAHAQDVVAAPRRLLASIPNLTLAEIPQGDLCCGSAGTYNIEQPALAAELGRRKAATILQTGADILATGNIGCMIQIRTYLEEAGRPLPLYHTVELLDLAYRAASSTRQQAK